MTDVPPPSSTGISGLVGDALRAANDVVRAEIALFREEMIGSLRNLIIGVAMIVAAAVFVIVGMLELIGAVVKWLAMIVHSEALSAFIVGCCLLVVALILALTGRSRITLETLAATRTSRQVKQDAKVIQERVQA